VVIGGVARYEEEEAGEECLSPISPKARSRLTGSMRQQKDRLGTAPDCRGAAKLKVRLGGVERDDDDKDYPMSPKAPDSSRPRRFQRRPSTPAARKLTTVFRLDSGDTSASDCDGGHGRSTSLARSYSLLGAEHHWLGNDEPEVLVPSSSGMQWMPPLRDLKVTPQPKPVFGYSHGFTMKMGPSVPAMAFDLGPGPSSPVSPSHRPWSSTRSSSRSGIRRPSQPLAPLPPAPPSGLDLGTMVGKAAAARARSAGAVA